MRIYIAYKYRCIVDKDKLIKDLGLISDALEAKGHEPFILGRDVHKWGCSTKPAWITIPHIFTNIKKSDLVLAFIDCDVKSFGLPVEAVCAKLLNKKIILIIKKDLKEAFLRKSAAQVIEFENLQDALDQLNV